MGLVLRAVEVAGPWRWRWVLAEAGSDRPLASHLVELDPSSDEVTAFGDVYGYARWRAAPDRRAADEARIVERAGEWAGRVLLGEAVGAAIAAATPVTVRVSVPAVLAPVLAWPLELAHVGGEPLAARGDVSLVYDVDSGPGRPKAPVPDTLRVLAVFSQPADTGVVALRRARYELGRLIRRIASRQRLALELRVVQYGATRERLAEIAGDGDSWDVLHLSGHGGPGAFLLERPDGSLDRVDAADLVALLRPLRARVKLAVVSACESAAGVTAETLRLVGLADRAALLTKADPGAELTGLAQVLVRELDCAAVGMRYPVTDEFAIAFGDALYEQLLSRRQPADVAMARAVALVSGVVPAGSAQAPFARSAVSLVTPGLFGVRADGLRLVAPAGDLVLDPARARMAYFPPEPERFVGRAAAMAAASAALAPESGRTAVLLHGMAGAGKTACAVELAYRHQDSFGALAFWQAPTREDEWTSALASLAAALEIQLGGHGFRMTGHIGTAAALAAFLPRLRRVMADSAVLLVLDNLETLLTPEGGWRDPAWGQLIDALAGHDGESRLILTSRIPPGGFEGGGFGGGGFEGGALVLPVHALSLDEAVTLARELPNLRALLHVDDGPGLAAAPAEGDRDRVRRVLRVVQGHPKLLELADAAAAGRDVLDKQLDGAERAAGGQELEAFFRDGESVLDPGRFLGALAGWTTGALAVLPDSARLLAAFVACLEDGDRQLGIIYRTWGGLWRRLERPGDPQDPRPLLEVLARAALIRPDPVTAAFVEVPPVFYRVHPGVAKTIVAEAGLEVAEAADAEMAMYWAMVTREAQERESGEVSSLVAWGGLAAAPYLLRRRAWESAGFLIDQALQRHKSPGTVQAALPLLRRVADATGAPVNQAILARTLASVDPVEAERLLRGALEAAAGNYGLASVIAGDLVRLLRDAGRLSEALEVLSRKAGHTRRAGLGPWSRLFDQAQRSQILARMGEHGQVLAETADLLERMDRLPVRGSGSESAISWSVRELVLNTGRESALATREWQRCLTYNQEILTSQLARNAGEYEMARARFNDAGPLIRLGRLAEAAGLLQDCQRIFENHQDIPALAMVFSVSANLESAQGHRAAAADLERTALRLCYVRPAPHDVAISHHNLSRYLDGADPAARRSHLLAAGLLFRLAGMNHEFGHAVRMLAEEPPEASTLSEVIEVTGQTEGVRLGDLLDALEPDRRVVEEALAEITRVVSASPGPDDDGP